MTPTQNKLSGLSSAKKKVLFDLLRKKRPAEGGTDRIEPREDRLAPLPLSFSQLRLWFLDRLHPGDPVYNLPSATRILGSLHLPSLALALAGVADRHEALRTTFAATEDGEPVQVIAPRFVPRLPVVDLAALPAVLRDHEIRRMSAFESRLPFDLEKGPLLRSCVFRIADDEHLLLLVMHHIVSDGWSMGVLVNEIGALYPAFLAGRPSPLPELPIQYPDFALWQRRRLAGAFLEAELDWWRSRLAGMSPVLELPADHPRQAVRSTRGAGRAFLIDPAALSELQALSRRHETTLFMTLLAGFFILLQRYTGEDDLAVATPIAGRTRAELGSLIGFFINTLVLRTDLGGHPSFSDLLTRVRETTLSSYAHQELPFERLVEELAPERDLSRPPLVQVMFTMENTPVGTLEHPGIEIIPEGTGLGASKFELTCTCREIEAGLFGMLDYSRELFEAPTMVRLAGHLERLLSGVLAEPQRPLAEIPLLAPGERHQLLAEWNDTEAGYPRGHRLHELVAAQAEKTPGAVAAVDENERVTYRELVDRARQLAGHLARLGVKPDGRVGVLLERSLAMVTGLLGVLEAGAAYVPLDPTLPEERLAMLAESAGLAAVVTQDRYAALLPVEGAPVVFLAPDGGRAWRSDGSDGSDRSDRPGPGDQGLAYVLYTSGSTGTPKGVMIPHRGIVNRLLWMQEAYGLTAEDRVLQKTPFGFDVSVWELFWPLLTGARLVLAQPEGHKDPRYLADLIAREKITTVHFVPSMLEVFLETPGLEALASLRRVVASGEALPPQLVRRFFSRLPQVELHNLYGPTEASVDVSFWPCVPEPPGDVVPIGRPIANHQLHVVDRTLAPQPVGVPGELLLGGPGLARGYLGRPDLTAAVFIPDPFGSLTGGQPGGRLYRTGDLVRRLADGTVHYLGRIDHQVKIRGFRIELGEIEAALAEHPAVTGAAVLVRGEGSEKRLVAYLASDRSDDLRRWLAGRLPEPMIPSAFVVLPRLPLNANGKVDRRALAKIAPERSAGREYMAPRTPVEETLARLFAEVLGEERTGERIGLHDHFFELGGHSLAAQRLASRVRAALGVELPLRAIFEAPTVADLALRCAAPAGAETSLPLVARPRDPQGDPLSFTQERFWFLERLTPGTSTYNLPSRMRLRGPLDRARLGHCFTEICRRHEILRTRFELRGNVPNKTPVQVVDPPAPQVLPLVDLTALPEDRRLREAELQAGEEADQPFDLERGPLLRAVLVRIGAEEHAVLLSLHHIITDGWSMGILFGEVAALYQTFADGQPSPLPELPVQYADVARWQREVLAGPALQEQLAWWRRHLDGAPPSLDLPLDRVRPAVQTFLGASVSGRFPAELTGGLRALANREGASLFMVLLAGFGLLASRLSGQSDVVVGSPVAGRGRPELESLIGCFLNTLALRLDLGGPAEAEGGLTGRRLLGRSLTGRALLRRAREAALGAYAHQDVPFERLLEDLQPERDLSRTPLFQIFLNMLSFPASASRMPDGLVLEPLGGTGVDSKFDLTLYAAEDADGIGLSLVYNAGLFDGPRVEEMVRQLQLVLEQIAADPDAPVESFSLLTPEAAAVLPDPREPLDDAWVGGVHELFAEQARLHPERPAVADSEVAWSHGELAEAAARLAGHLRAAGLAPQEPVAIWAHRGARTVQAVFGTLWAGGAFVLLDPAYPPARLAEMVELAAPRYWIQSGLEIAAAGAPPAEVEEVLQRLDLRGRLRLPCEISSPPVEPAQVGPDDTVAIAFTSGSTGAPKGIVQRHGSMSHFLPWLAERFGIGPEDRFSLLSGLSHDPYQRDLFTSLCLGASLCAPTGEEMTTPGRLAAWMARERITVSNLTPAMAQLLTETGSEPLPHLRAAFLIGDALTRADVERLRRLAPGAVCVNLYGTTETQRALGMHLVTREEIEDPRAPQVLPLGRGMRDVQLLVTAGERLAGIGELGEIQVRSPHLARGYLGGEGFGDLYRTGDLGRYRPDGEVVFAGRADQQVKIRGFRIEPAEVEAALGRQPGVREAVVLARSLSQEDRPGDRELVAYVAGNTGEEIDPTRLREALRSRLPGYMVPSAFVLLDELPVTPNGKVDRRSLSQMGARIVPERSGDREGGFVAPRTPTEETLAALWVEVLGSRRTGGRAGVRDHFFGLGGHSLLATRLLAAIQDAFGVELPLRIVFERPTLEEMAAAIAEAGETAHQDEPVVRLPRSPGVNRFPVSFSQLREWILDRLEPGNPAYNIPNNLRIGGPLGIPILAEALRRLMQRHEVFRTAFVAEDEEPLQVVLPEVSLEVPVIDLSALPEALRETELPRQVRHHAGTGFDLTAAPLLRVRVIRLAAEDHALLMTVHHIISDGWSMGILNQELAALYEASAQSLPSLESLPSLPVQYADYAVWQRRRLDAEALERQVAYWRRQLTGAPPLLELPTDRPRPPVRSSRGRRIPFLLPQPLAGRLEELALRHGATLFMVLLAGYQALLARWSGQDDVVAGTYSGNRPRRELEPLIGFFVNTLVHRTDLSGDPSFTALLGRVRETTLGSYAHRDVPFEKLLETLQLPRDPSRTPLFQALLVLHNFPPAQANLSTGVRLEALPVAAEKSDYDLSLWLGEAPQGVGGMLEYSTDLFDEPTMVRFAGQLRLLLEGAAADPDRNVWTLPLISEEEQARQLAAWSHGPSVPEGSPLLHRLVEEQALRTPTAVAVEAGDIRLTYADLVEQARRVARGIEPGTIVALAAERTPELIVQMLGVLRAGAAYLPIDPAYPVERREYMVADSGAHSAPGAAYVIYTSGSTGLPKGVVVPHRAIASFVRAARETYEIGPGDRVLQLTSVSFDTSAEEIWPALASGATLILRPDDMMASIPHFLRELERLGITHLDLPTAFWHELVAGMETEDLQLPHGLRLVILGGEEALADRFALWHRRVGSSVRLVNTYGPTEATIVATRRELSGLAPGGTVPLGRPIPGARTYVLDRFFTPVPPGVRGELWIGGTGVAQGYLGRPDLTADRFRPDPFSDPSDPSNRSDAVPKPGARLYRTGDLAFLTPDGDLIFAGRADRQLKIRGYRVEPGEIEAALRLHPALRDAVVDVRGARADQRLIAWIVAHEGTEAPGASDLRAFLRDRLPEPLLPAAFVPLSALPLTPSGKVDRRGLSQMGPAPAEARLEGATYVEPQSALERTIAEIYRALLRVGRVGLHDNFFDLGGHSLLIVRAHQKLREALGKEIPVLDLFRFPTVAALARHLGGEETGNLQKVQGLAEQQRAAQQRQKAAMERLRRPGRIPSAGRR